MTTPTDEQEVVATRTAGGIEVTVGGETIGTGTISEAGAAEVLRSQGVSEEVIADALKQVGSPGVVAAIEQFEAAQEAREQIQEDVAGALATGAAIQPEVLERAGLTAGQAASVGRQQEAIRRISAVPGARQSSGEFDLLAAIQGGISTDTLLDAGFQPDDIQDAQTLFSSIDIPPDAPTTVVTPTRTITGITGSGLAGIEDDAPFTAEPEDAADFLEEGLALDVTPESAARLELARFTEGRIVNVTAALQAGVSPSTLRAAGVRDLDISQGFAFLESEDISRLAGFTAAPIDEPFISFDVPAQVPDKQEIINAALRAGLDSRDANRLATLATQRAGVTQAEVAEFEQLNAEFMQKVGVTAAPTPGQVAPIPTAVARQLTDIGQEEVTAGFPVPPELIQRRELLASEAAAVTQVTGMTTMGGTVGAAGQELQIESLDTIIEAVRNGSVTPENAKILAEALPSIPSVNAKITKELLLSLVPVEGTRRNWGDAPGWANGIGVAADIAAFIPLIGQTSGLVRAGASAPAIGSRIVIAEVTGPLQAVRHPFRTVATLLEPIETALSPRKIPINAMALKEATIRVPVVEGARPAVFDIAVPEEALIRSPGMRGGTIELGNIEDPAIRAQVAAALSSRDVAARAAAEGIPGPTPFELGDLTGSMVLRGPRLQSVIGPAVVHNTPDLRPFLGGIEAAGSEGGLYTGPSVMERFIRGKATGGTAGLPAELQAQVEAGLLAKDPVPGALIIRDPQVLDTLAGSNKLWAGHAEIELVVPDGVHIPAPSQILFTRTQDGSRAALAIVGDPLRPDQIARLKVVGAVDTVRNIFKPPGKIKGAILEVEEVPLDETIDIGARGITAKVNPIEETLGPDFRTITLTREGDELVVFLEKDGTTVNADILRRPTATSGMVTAPEDFISTPTEVRAVLRLIKRIYPEADTATGIRTKSGRPQTLTLPTKPILPAKAIPEAFSNAVDKIESAIQKSKRVDELRAEGRTADALKLAAELQDDANEIARILNRTSRDASIRLSGRLRPAVLYTGQQDIVRALESVSRESLRTPVPEREITVTRPTDAVRATQVRADESVTSLRPARDDGMARRAPLAGTDGTGRAAPRRDEPDGRADLIAPVPQPDITRRLTPTDEPVRVDEPVPDPTRARDPQPDITRVPTPTDTPGRIGEPAPAPEPTRARAPRTTPPRPTAGITRVPGRVEMPRRPEDPRRPGRPDIPGPGRPRPRGFFLPDGSPLPPGEFPAVVEWGQGENTVRYNLVTNERTWRDRDPDGRDPDQTFIVVQTSRSPIIRREFRMGAFDVVIDNDGVDFETNRFTKRRGSTSGLKRRNRKGGL